LRNVPIVMRILLTSIGACPPNITQIGSVMVVARPPLAGFSAT